MLAIRTLRKVPTAVGAEAKNGTVEAGKALRSQQGLSSEDHVLSLKEQTSVRGTRLAGRSRQGSRSWSW